MDFALRCNSLKCRVQLVDQAVVTTCSHIFCLPCSDTLGLSNTNSDARSCPACGTHLGNPDDAVVTQLNPTEDYKTSVLSGLSPGVIVECASRGMAFWSYQATQEIFYQEFLMKSMTDKYQSLSGQMDKLINNANAEITSLREKISALNIEHKDLEGKNQQLAEAYKKKCKDNGQLHKLYQQAKQRQVSEMMAEAAEEDASHVAHKIGVGYRPQGQNGVAPQSRSRSDGSGELRYKLGGSGARQFGSQTMATPSGHRTQLHQQPRSTQFMYGTNNPVMQDRLHQGTPLRQPLGNMGSHLPGNGGLGNSGLMAGAKVGRQPQRPFHLSPDHLVNPFGASGAGFG